MKCPYCGNEMTVGYVVTDGLYIAFRKEKYESAKVGKKDESGIQLASKHFGAASLERAYCCNICKKIILEYDE